MPEQMTTAPPLLECFWCRDLIVGELARTDVRNLAVHPECKPLEDEHEAVYERARQKARH